MLVTFGMEGSLYGRQLYTIIYADDVAGTSFTVSEYNIHVFVVVPALQ